MKLEIDLDANQRQTIYEIYNRWNIDELSTKDFKNKNLNLYNSRQKNERDTIFTDTIKKKYLVNEVYDSNTEFYIPLNSQDDRMNFYIQTNKSKKSWFYSIRLINHGILLGCWLAFLLILFNVSYLKSIWLGILITLLWQTNWNIIEIPIYIYQELKWLFKEIYFRFNLKQWSSNNLKYIVLSITLLWAVVKIIFDFFKLKINNPKTNFAIWIVYPFIFIALEAPLIYFGSIICEWNIDASWWKVWVGSLQFRFLTVGFIIAILFQNKLNFLYKKSPIKEYLNLPFNALLPLVFIIAGGWAWCLTVFHSNPTDLLIRIQTFWMALVLSFVLGSRSLSAIIGILAYCYLNPPSAGHWISASQFASLSEGLFLGWILSPFKGIKPFNPLPIDLKTLFFTSFLGWIFGVYLTSLDFNVYITWPLYLFFLILFLKFQKPSISIRQIENH